MLLHGQVQLCSMVQSVPQRRENLLVEVVLDSDDVKLPVDLVEVGAVFRLAIREAPAANLAAARRQLGLLGHQGELAQAQLNLLVPDLLLPRQAQSEKGLGGMVNVVLSLDVVDPRDLGQLRPGS